MTSRLPHYNDENLNTWIAGLWSAVQIWIEKNMKKGYSLQCSTISKEICKKLLVADDISRWYFSCPLTEWIFLEMAKENSESNSTSFSLFDVHQCGAFDVSRLNFWRVIYVMTSLRMVTRSVVPRSLCVVPGHHRFRDRCSAGEHVEWQRSAIDWGNNNNNNIITVKNKSRWMRGTVKAQVSNIRQFRKPSSELRFKSLKSLNAALNLCIVNDAFSDVDGFRFGWSRCHSWEVRYGKDTFSSRSFWLWNSCWSGFTGTVRRTSGFKSKTLQPRQNRHAWRTSLKRSFW